jgi:hypothetical protein
MKLSGQLHAPAALFPWKNTEFFFYFVNYKLIKYYEGFDDLRAVAILGYNTVYSVYINGRFRGTCRLYLQGRRIIQARNKREAGSE